MQHGTQVSEAGRLCLCSLREEDYICNLSKFGSGYQGKGLQYRLHVFTITTNSTKFAETRSYKTCLNTKKACCYFFIPGPPRLAM